MGGPELGAGGAVELGIGLEKASELEVPLPTPANVPFPYPTPYGIQVDLMRTVFEAIEQRKIAIVSHDQVVLPCPRFGQELKSRIRSNRPLVPENH